ncbi:hypothetical protein Sinac_1520 [Singulisphaera acidiphila DSM 18658]|uniref:Uncharacterized protein n=1 Tax=Singulisphaera acidiphila (strain ATCC BAA-1392 / DSM 18658 / VKM B-2454 / MOB10) TaxID=886293 RepID=L0D943_SINAD|nr:hypothetical protein Sinac_1520 [Singulisphaera acidiphila DSM 18658]
MGVTLIILVHHRPVVSVPAVSCDHVPRHRRGNLHVLQLDDVRGSGGLCRARAVRRHRPGYVRPTSLVNGERTRKGCPRFLAVEHDESSFREPKKRERAMEVSAPHGFPDRRVSDLKPLSMAQSLRSVRGSGRACPDHRRWDGCHSWPIGCDLCGPESHCSRRRRTRRPRRGHERPKQSPKPSSPGHEGDKCWADSSPVIGRPEKH